MGTKPKIQSQDQYQKTPKQKLSIPKVSRNY